MVQENGETRCATSPADRKAEGRIHENTFGTWLDDSRGRPRRVHDRRSADQGRPGTEVIWGDIATAESGSETRGTAKEGKACAESILGLLARGDASVRAAKQNGGITEVTSVDHSARNFLNIVGEWCTLVRGH
jgi:hypothetical protein